MHLIVDFAPSSAYLEVVRWSDFFSSWFSIVPHLFVRGKVNVWQDLL